MIVAAFAVAAVLVVAGWWAAGWWGRRVLWGKVRRQAVVTLKSGESFTGVLFDIDGHCLCLRDAVSLTPEQVPVDGEVVVLRSDVAFIQLP